MAYAEIDKKEAVQYNIRRMREVDQAANLKEEVLSLYHDKSTWKEGEHLEFKRAANKLPDDMWETYSAFANTHGGIIVLGVEDNGKVSGVGNTPMLLSRLSTLLNNGEKVSTNLCLGNGAFCSMELADKEVIAIRIPAASVNQKPVYYNGNMGNSFFRSHEADLRCKEEMIQQMLRDKMGECKSSRLMPHTSWDCIDPKTWEEYLNLMKGFVPGHPWTKLAPKALLEKLGGYVHSEDGSDEGLTLAGLLMFGTDDAIRKYFPRYHVDYFEFDGSEKRDFNKRWADRILNDGSWNANLFQFFYRILPRLTESLKRPFRLNHNLISQIDTSAHKAVREAFANALIHADYDGDCGVVIRKYPDKIEFANPGTLLLSRERIMHGGQSKCRNVALQAMFYFMGIIEKAGSGVDIILKGWMENSFMPPQIEEIYDPARIIWTLPFVSIIPKEEEEKLKEHVGIKLYESLEAEQRTLLLIISHLKEVGNKEIRELYPYIHSYDLTKKLVDLERLGCLEADGRTSGKVYRLAHVLPQESQFASDQEYPPSVTFVRSNDRVTRSEMKQAILDICRDRWVTNTELCNILNRKRQALRIALAVLEDTGALDLRYPDNANHPHQAYHTNDSSKSRFK